MLAIESWPNPVLGHGPHVRASGKPEILTDLARPDLDLVIWARQVPAEWTQALNGRCATVESLILSGNLTTILSELKAPDCCEGYPDFMIEDVAQIAALAAVFAVSDRLTLHLGSEPDPAQIASPAKLKAFCCYGESALGWSSGSSSGKSFLSFLEPFGIAFGHIWNDDRIQIHKQIKNQNIFLTLSAL